jgi:ABC-type nitrate/sulfonate/bicarbonate transport system substrate-binding protein
VGAEYEIDPADIELYRCPPEVMVALLGDLDAVGAAEGWLRERGLAENELDRLRARFLSG